MTEFAACSARANARRDRWQIQRRAGVLMVSAFCTLLLAACQSAGPGEVLGIGAPISEKETVGSGSVSVTLLLPRSGSSTAVESARDMYDGARLAVTELGGGSVKLTVMDTKGSADLARQQAEEAVASGTKLILTGHGASAAIARVSSTDQPPVIDLSSAQADRKGTFALASDEISSALGGVRAAVAAKQDKIVAVVPEDMSSLDKDRLSRGIRKEGGVLIGQVTYPAAENAIAAVLAGKRSAFEKASTLVILGSGRAPIAVANAAAVLGDKITTLVGSSGWARELFTAPVLNGALIAMVDQRSLAELGDRYKAATGRTLSLDAAFAYDAVALATGLVRSGGGEAISVDTLRSKAGFRGATGVFRFDDAGIVERRYSLYRIEGGKPVLLVDGENAF